MGYPIQQSQTAQPLLFLLVQTSDHITGLTGASPTVTISKNGSAFASPAGAVSEIGSGWYKVAGNATDSATLGPLALHATATGGDPVDDIFPVVAYNLQDAVRLGLTALPNVNFGVVGSLPAAVDTSGRVDVLKINGTSQTARDLGASVLISSGTGVGQLAVTAGVINSNTTQWNGQNALLDANNLPKVDIEAVHGTALAVAKIPATLAGSDVSGNIAGTVGGVAGNVMGNVSGSVGSVSGNVGGVTGVTFPSTVGDATAANQNTINTNVNAVYTRIGAPSGASVSADIAAVEANAVIAAAGVNGTFTYNPVTGILVLKDKTSTNTIATLTVTVDGSNNITNRASS
jgi:hypothetical protein